MGGKNSFLSFWHICWWRGICDDANSDTEWKSFKGFCNFLLYGFRDSSTFEIINLECASLSPRVKIKPTCVLATYRPEFRALLWLTSISKDVRDTLPTLSLSYSVFAISYHFIPCKMHSFFFNSLQQYARTVHQIMLICYQPHTVPNNQASQSDGAQTVQLLLAPYNKWPVNQTQPK
jgi:hypothetical protein